MVSDGFKDAVMTAGLKLMADLIVDEIGDDVSFALFVDWRDGHPRSYVSSIPRPTATSILGEWFVKSSASDGRRDNSGSGSKLQVKCVELGKQMVEEDIDVVLFLVTWGDAGEVAWFASLPTAREIVNEWEQSEKRSGN